MPRKLVCECGSCERCRARSRANAYYRANPDKVRAASKRATQRWREKNREEYLARRKATWRNYYDPEKNRARGIAYRAVKSGQLLRKSCEVCGSPESQAHHEDYSRPLDVRWLCSTHHAQVHRTVCP